MKNQGHTSRARRRSRRAFLQTLGGAAAAFSLSSRATAAEEPKLNFYNWDTYIGENTLADFKAATGIDVNLDLFGDNDELFAKIRGGNPGYDVIVPTNDYVQRMWIAGLLVKLDHARIPNFRKNIAPDFQDGDFDPGRLYSIPYMWGTMGIAYRKSKVEKPTSWSSVWGPESDQHKGRIAWISESDAMLGMAMKSMGHSYNSNEEAHITAAADLLAKYKKNILTIAEDNGRICSPPAMSIWRSNGTATLRNSTAKIRMSGMSSRARAVIIGRTAWRFRPARRIPKTRTRL